MHHCPQHCFPHVPGWESPSGPGRCLALSTPGGTGSETGAAPWTGMAITHSTATHTPPWALQAHLLKHPEGHPLCLQTYLKFFMFVFSFPAGSAPVTSMSCVTPATAPPRRPPSLLHGWSHHAGEPWLEAPATLDLARAAGRRHGYHTCMSPPGIYLPGTMSRSPFGDHAKRKQLSSPCFCFATWFGKSHVFGCGDP